MKKYYLVSDGEILEVLNKDCLGDDTVCEYFIWNDNIYHFNDLYESREAAENWLRILSNKMKNS